MTSADLTSPVDDVHDESARQLRVVRQSFAEAAERAARWEPQPCPELSEAIRRVAAMERQT